MRNEAYAEIMEKKLRRLFPDEIERQRAINALHAYGTEPHEHEPERVRLDILKLAGADLDEIERYVESAHQDYRDLIAWAEYPEEINSPTYKMPKEEVDAIRGRDRAQYERWLFGA